MHKQITLVMSFMQYAQPELCPQAEHRVELIGGSGVYVTLPRLEEARREAKNGTQLARKLMDAFWDRETLARSSLSSKSKYQYQQLDPNVISTIEGMYIPSLFTGSLFFTNTLHVYTCIYLKLCARCTCFRQKHTCILNMRNTRLHRERPAQK